MAEILDVQVAERTMLRDELHDLKSCQVRYFSLSVSVTGLLVGFGLKLAEDPCGSLFFYAPLLVVLPCWWIFFDKATTITRIVGYVRALERIMIGAGSPTFNYVGWENALAQYRVKEGIRKSKIGWLRRFLQLFRPIGPGFVAVLPVRSTHRYWLINWWTFFALSVVCWLAGSGALCSPTPAVAELLCRGRVPGGFIIATSLINLRLLGLLTGGRDYSYESSYKFWVDHVLEKRG